jgi:hypothetical protein
MESHVHVCVCVCERAPPKGADVPTTTTKRKQHTRVIMAALSSADAAVFTLPAQPTVREDGLRANRLLASCFSFSMPEQATPGGG